MKQICANQVSLRSARLSSADPRLLLRREKLPALTVPAIATAQVWKDLHFRRLKNIKSRDSSNVRQENDPKSSFTELPGGPFNGGPFTDDEDDDLGFTTIAIIVLGALFALVCLVFIIIKVS